jgi:hypothetical protein
MKTKLPGILALFLAPMALAQVPDTAPPPQQVAAASAAGTVEQAGK